MNFYQIQGRTLRQGKLFFWLALTIALCLSVFAINRGPLYYFDTGSYFKQGDAALSLIFPDNQNALASPLEQPDGAGPTTKDDDTVTGSRSMLYALLIAIFWHVDALGGVVLINLLSVFLASWLAARVARRAIPSILRPAEQMTLPLLLAALTSLPFYVAYLMPDIFVAVLLILIATVAAMPEELNWAEYLLALVLAAVAVLLHPSHLAVAGLMLPFVLLVAVFRRGKAQWLSIGFVACLVIIGVAERKVFEFAAETAAHKQVVYTPHITARLIVDGPGMDYLEENCPSPEIATCSLYDALSWSDDPYRLTASHIIFERSPKLGSFRLMSEADQAAVANEQREFFFQVLASKPLATLYALIRNSSAQLMTNSVQMTIPTQAVINSIKPLSGLPDERLGVLGDAVLAKDRSWLETTDRIHSTIYLVSLLVIVGLLLWPRQVAPSLKFFGLFLLLGIWLNALVCGGLSQPADRYGARVMWLLPFTAVFILLASFAPRPDGGGSS